MTKYVALLRGIGPTNPNMKGEKLKAFFEEFGFTNVQTVLGSGNVIFESTSNDTNEMAERIENVLPQKLGFNSTTVIRSQSALQALVDQDPFKGQQHSNTGIYLLLTFFRNPSNIPTTLPQAPDNKPYVLLGRIDDAVFGKIDLGQGKTPDYMVWLERQFGKDITSRTPKTIELILSKMNKTN